MVVNSEDAIAHGFQEHLVHLDITSFSPLQVVTFVDQKLMFCIDDSGRCEYSSKDLV